MEHPSPPHRPPRGRTHRHARPCRRRCSPTPATSEYDASVRPEADRADKSTEPHRRALALARGSRREMSPGVGRLLVSRLSAPTTALPPSRYPLPPRHPRHDTPAKTPTPRHPRQDTPRQDTPANTPPPRHPRQDTPRQYSPAKTHPRRARRRRCRRYPFTSRTRTCCGRRSTHSRASARVPSRSLCAPFTSLGSALSASPKRPTTNSSQCPFASPPPRENTRQKIKGKQSPKLTGTRPARPTSSSPPLSARTCPSWRAAAVNAPPL